jgi:hypothetical protein
LHCCVLMPAYDVALSVEPAPSALCMQLRSAWICVASRAVVVHYQSGSLTASGRIRRKSRGIKCEAAKPISWHRVPDDLQESRENCNFGSLNIALRTFAISNVAIAKMGLETLASCSSYPWMYFSSFLIKILIFSTSSDTLAPPVFLIDPVGETQPFASSSA